MLGERISFLRIQKGMSQAELAQKLHLSPSTLGSYEQGRRTPSVNILVALADEFDVSVDYLASGRVESRHDPVVSRGKFGEDNATLLRLIALTLLKWD